jgi:hypothetical protein
MIMACTRDEYCDTLLTLGTCNSRAGTVAREYTPYRHVRRHVDAAVFRRLEHRLHETVRIPANEDPVIAVVERDRLRGMT